jgi:hypothetical protein
MDHLPRRAANDVAQLLSALGQGDPHATAQLLPFVYKVLRDLAAQRMAREPPGQTLQPTALVHEGCLLQEKQIRARPTSLGRRNDL